MPTTFSTVHFKNQTIDTLTGNSGSASRFTYANPYNGVQAASPDAAPAGTLEFANLGHSLQTVWANMTPARNGVSVLSIPCTPVNPAGAAAVSSLTTVRLYNNASTPVMDIEAETGNGSGGGVLNSLTSTAGVGNTLQGFCFSMDSVNASGTFSLNLALRNRLVDLWVGASATVPRMGFNISGASLFQMWTGAAPSVDAPPTGTLLLTTTLGGSNIWASASGGSAALSLTPASTAVGTGTAGYARLTKTYGTDTFVMQGSVGTSGTDFVVNNVVVVSGVTSVTLSEATISL